MDGVVEIGKVGEIVDSGPLDRCVVSIARSHGLEKFGVLPDHGVTGHADFRRRNPCKRTFLNGSVTIAAVDAQASNMVRMAEGHGLGSRHAFLRHVRRTQDRVPAPDNRRSKEHEAKDRDLRNRIEAWVKDLSHTRIANRSRTCAARDLACSFGFSVNSLAAKKAAAVGSSMGYAEDLG